MEIIPVFDKLLIKVLEENPLDLVSSVISVRLPGKTILAEIVAVGPGRVLSDGSINSISFSVGTKVLLPRLSGIQISSADTSLFLIREEEILAKVS